MQTTLPTKQLSEGKGTKTNYILCRGTQFLEDKDLAVFRRGKEQYKFWIKNCRSLDEGKMTCAILILKCIILYCWSILCHLILREFHTYTKVPKYQYFSLEIGLG